MIWWYRTKNWVVAHKNWLMLMVMFIISYLLGKQANNNYLQMANLAKEQYKKDSEKLEELHSQKQARDKKISKKTEVIETALAEARDDKIEELEKKHTSPDDVFQNIGIKKK